MCICVYLHLINTGRWCQIRSTVGSEVHRINGDVELALRPLTAGSPLEVRIIQWACAVEGHGVILTLSAINIPSHDDELGARLNGLAGEELPDIADDAANPKVKG